MDSVIMGGRSRRSPFDSGSLDYFALIVASFILELEFELEFELIQSHMTQKTMLRVKWQRVARVRSSMSRK